MNPKYDIYEEIDRYLNEELSEAELVQFNQKLSTDAEFKSLVEAQQIANEVIIDQEMIKLKERMSKDLSHDSNTGSTPWGKIILFSAVVTSASLYTYISYNRSDSEEVKEHVAAKSAETISAGDRSLKNNASTSPDDQPITIKQSNKTATTSINPTIQNTTLEESTHKEPLVEAEKTVAVSPIITTHKDEEVKKQVPVVADPVTKVNCAVVKITAEVRVDYGFDNNGEATIIIDQLSVKGGTAPYSYALNHSDFEKDNRFTGIKDGIYHVRIKDQNQCISDVKKDVTVKIPVKEIDEAFVPSRGERWKFPLKDHADATISIVNKAGAVVYSTTLSGGYPEEWDGRSNAGVELESGNYYFVIQYAHDVVRGHISIVR